MPKKASQRNSLYCGSDLINAATRSNIDRTVRDWYTGYRNGFSILLDALRARGMPEKNIQYELVIAVGLIPDTTETATVAYAGSGTNRDWCLSTTFSEHAQVKVQCFSSAAEMLNALRNTLGAVDVVFVESVDEKLVTGLPVDFIQIPAWIKQRVRLEGNWVEQVRSLRRGTRQEVSRILRKYGYECNLTRQASDMSWFYDQQYRPHVISQYGDSAIIVTKNRFLRECQRGELLQLIQHDSVVASALLRPIGKTMAIVWTGMNPVAVGERIPGATDALDYFSLLYAHLKGCQWLDFGPSRADICDGTLRYKRKWGSEATAGFFTQPSIHLACNDRDGAAREFLRQHAFISVLSGTLTAITATTTDDNIEAAQQRIEQLIMPGIVDYRIIAFSPLCHTSRAKLLKIHRNITLFEADSVADAMKFASL